MNKKNIKLFFTLLFSKLKSIFFGPYCASKVSQIKQFYLFFSLSLYPLKKHLFLSQKGFTLLGTLITAGLGLTVGFGILKISDHSLETTKVVSTLSAQQDLHYTVSEILSRTEDCRWNLSPSRLSDSSNKKGTLQSLVKTKRNNYDTPPVTEDDVTVLKVGNFKGVLDIKKIELANTVSSNTKERTFIVYYSKKGLGKYNTLGGGTCSPSNTTGCFTHSCKMDYDCSNNDCSAPDDKCTLLNCASARSSGSNIADITCLDNQYLKGFDSDGDPLCVDISECPAGQYLRGFNSDGSKNCAEAGECPTGTSFTGFDATTGDRVCVALAELDSSCPAGEHALGYDAEGAVVCSTFCTGGQQWNDEDSKCKCPTAKPNWDGSACVASCSGGREADSEKNCVCKGGRTFDGSNCVCQGEQTWNESESQCKCPTNKPRLDGSNCVACPESSPYWNGLNCGPCPTDKPKWDEYTSTCVACQAGEKWNGTKCANSCAPHRTWSETKKKCVCPETTPKWNGSTCVACSGGRVWNDSASMCLCTGGRGWNGTRCVCPQYRPKWNSATSTCVACPSNKSRWTGTQCDCPRGQSWSIAKAKCACPSNKPLWLGAWCSHCPWNKPKWNGSNCVKCPSNKSRWTGTQCDCPRGQSWSVAKAKCACPSNKPRWNGSWCSSCPWNKPKWNGSNCVKCPSNKPRWNSSTSSCEACPNDQPKWNGSWCSRCPYNKPKWDGSNCVKCPSNKPRWDSSAKKCQCPWGQSWNGSKCVCPSDRPNWNGSYCVRCPWYPRYYWSSYNKPKWNGSNCVACPTKHQWNGTTCTKCESNKPHWDWKNKICVSCPPNKPEWNYSKSKCWPCHNNTVLSSSGPYCTCYYGEELKNRGTTNRKCVCPSNRRYSKRGPPVKDIGLINGRLQSLACSKCSSPNHYWAGSTCQVPIGSFAWRGELFCFVTSLTLETRKNIPLTIFRSGGVPKWRCDTPHSLPCDGRPRAAQEPSERTGRQVCFSCSGGTWSSTHCR